MMATVPALAPLTALLFWYLLMSLVTFCVYAIDRRAARRKLRRVSERQLHLWALAGGWPGAMLAQQRLRHKTVKRDFHFWYRVSILGNVLALLCLMSLLVLAWPAVQRF